MCVAYLAGRTLRSSNLSKVTRSIRPRSMDVSNPSVTMSSHMCVYSSDSDAALRSLSMDWFVDSARGYRLTGEPAHGLCEHNAEVAAVLSRSQVAQTWRLLRLMCTAAASATTCNMSHGMSAQPSSICSLPTSLHLTEPGTGPL